MAQCPVCGAAVKDDFGLIQCFKCNTSLLVEIDGSVKSAKDQADEVVSISDEDSSSSEYDSNSNFESDEPNESVDSEFSYDEEEASADVISEEEVSPAREPSDISEIAEYGNSEASQGREGAYFYNIYISEIDTAELRNEVLEALTDRRFLWDAEQLVKNIKNGNLTLKKVGGIKAAVLINRLKVLPIDIKWDQHAITD